jgi:CubicO group peptidase (beta-lactamase class C family)
VLVRICENGRFKHFLTKITEFFDNLERNQLMWLPGDKIAYSDQAYILLGMVMQNITGKPFAELLHDSITKPLDMPVTGFNQPDHSRGIIPVGAGRVFWDQNIGNFNAYVCSFIHSRTDS